MAYNPQFLYYLTTPGGKFWTADQQPSGEYVINGTTSSNPLADKLYLKSLPINWQDLELEWKRHKNYFGTFRSQTMTLEFVKDSAAILFALFSEIGSGGIEAKCVLRIDMWQPDFTYSTVYSSEINFGEGEYDYVNETFKASTLDSRLFTLLEANASTQYNIPFWYYDSGWLTDAFFVYNEGLKLQWSSRWITDVPQTGVAVTSNATSIGYYTQIPLVYSQTIPYIGNELLQNQLISGNQDFKDNNTLHNNYSQNQYLLKPITVAPVGSPQQLTVKLDVNFTQIQYPNPPLGDNTSVFFKVVEIDNADTPTGYSELVASIIFPHDPGYAVYDMITVTNPSMPTLPTALFVTNNRVYNLEYSFIVPGSAVHQCFIDFDAFEVNIYNDGSANLRVNPTTSIGWKPFQLLDKIVKCLNSETTTPNGFPIIPIDTPYAGISEFLFNDADTVDTNPYTTLWTSGNALRNISGQQYITVSLADFFKTCFAVYGCGLGIEGDNIVIEPLSYFMDAATEIADLGTDVSNFKIIPLNDYAANNLRTGYKTQYQDFAQYVGTETSFYGLDVFNIQQDYKLPITRTKQDLDWTAPVVADPYKIELARAASNTNGGSSPSASNDNYLIETSGSVAALTDVLDPAGNVVGVSAYGLRTYPGIQTTDPTTPPYARGITYPDTMYNFGLSPSRCLWRKSGLMASICGTLQDRVIAFQKQYWQLFNGNTSIDVSGIASNLSGTIYTEVWDVEVSELSDRLFMPYLFKFDTKLPLNMYEIINSNPYGYISFSWIDQYSGIAQQYKGFIYSVKQKLGDNGSVSLELIAHPDTVI